MQITYAFGRADRGGAKRSKASRVAGFNSISGRHASNDALLPPSQWNLTASTPSSLLAVWNDKEVDSTGKIDVEESSFDGHCVLDGNPRFVSLVGNISSVQQTGKIIRMSSPSVLVIWDEELHPNLLPS